MPKSLVLGNGNILVGFDKYAQIKDFYFPYVGLEDQVGGFGINKIGVFAEGQMSWLSDADWEISINYQKETLASDIRAINKKLAVELFFVDVVYNEKDIFIKKATVHNLASNQRLIKIFFNQQFQLYDSSHANTAYYNPELKSIVHYKGRRVVIVSGDFEGNSFDDYATGLIGIEGKEGTFVDANDGQLSKNPIEYGSVDSTIGFSMMLEGGDSKELYYWLVVAKLFREAKVLNQYVIEKTPAYLMETTMNFWRAWVNKQNFNFYRLSDEIIDLFKKSLLIIRTHIDNRGGILASGDTDMLQYGRDNYSYMWPRDAAFIALAMDRAGYPDITKKFFEFCNEVVDESGYLFHKYRIDASLGSSWHPWVRDGEPRLPIQEDETAIVLYALWRHYETTRDLEFVESIYNSFIKKTADFMVDFRDPVTKLPRPTYDLWEEKFGVSTFTAACIVGALETAARFAKLLGKETARKKYDQAAQEVHEAILKYLYNEQDKTFYKQINIKNGFIEIDKTIDASSFYGVARFNILKASDPRLNNFMKIIEEMLTCKTEIGGIARYLNDNYYQISRDTPGNPWIITTLWLTQYHLHKAKKEADLDIVRDQLQWVVQRALPSGILSEQVNPYTGEQVSVAPLIWSHAEFVKTVVWYLEKLEELGICKMVNPIK